MKWLDKILDFKRATVMAIVNVTTDSFYAQSRAANADEVGVAVQKALHEGAGIIDIGGYSTRPGAKKVDVQTELNRVLEAVGVVKRMSPTTIVSIDTFRAEVAEEVLKRWGDCIINDISAGEFEPEILDVVARYGVPYVAMHTKGDPSQMMNNTDYENVVDSVVGYLSQRGEYIRSRGVEKIIIDPGFGFAKTTEQNYQLLGGLERVNALGYPMLVGVSRKSMLYKVLDVTPQQALSATTAVHWECLRKGATILRVHDVRAAVDTIKVFEYYKQHGDRV